MAATFVVEDGTGKASANSYVAEATADAYHENHGNPAAWSGAAQADKEEALRLATQAVDAKFIARFVGYRTSSTQALQWPRTGGTFLDGHTIDSDEVPTVLEAAVSELALQVINGETLMDDTETSPGTIKRTKVKVGPITDEVEYQGGQGPASTTFPKAETLLRDILAPVGRVTRA